MLESFAPVVNTHTRILIIGSMPGAASLQAQEYYAYRYNQFWRLMFDVLAGGRPPRNYADKLQTLLRHGIGLWDTLASCERTGSLDGRITHPVPNDFPALFAQFPTVQTLLFNGQAAARHFKRAFGFPADKTCQILPSTSPALAALSYDDKKTRWQAALASVLPLERL